MSKSIEAMQRKRKMDAKKRRKHRDLKALLRGQGFKPNNVILGGRTLCGCKGDPAGIEPMKRDPSCRAHAHHPGYYRCDLCADTGRVPAGFDRMGFAYIAPCGRCLAWKAKPNILSVEEIALGEGARVNAGEEHPWRAESELD